MMIADSTTSPSVSVVVNTIDRAASLPILLAALDTQSYRDFEVIVVVGPTRDATLDVLAPYAGRVRVLHCPQPNLSQSRNIGLLAAKGVIVAFVDDDAVPCPTWVQQLAVAFRDPTLDATGGAVYLIHPAQPAIQHRLGVASALAEMQNVRMPGEAPPPGALAHFWAGRPMGTNMAFRRTALLAIGGFDEFFEWVYDDADSALRLALSGGHFRALAEAVVYHVPASSRNRIVRTFSGRWWVGSKATAYFAIKNGAAAGETVPHIIRRLLIVVHSDWLLSGELRRNGKISARQAWSMRLRGMFGVLQGALAGLVRQRRLLLASQRVPRTGAAPLLPFLGAEGAEPPLFDPIEGVRSPSPVGLTGRREGGNGGAPVMPLRIAVLAPFYPAPGTGCSPGDPGYAISCLVQGLFALGHTVHVVAPGKAELVAFYGGAYVHRVPQPLSTVTRDMPEDLVAELNYSHLVYGQVRRLVFNDAVQIVHAPAPGLDGLVTARSGDIPLVVGRWPDTLKQAANPVLLRAQAARQALVDELWHSACRVVGDVPVLAAGSDGSYREVARRFAEIYRGCIIAESVTPVSPTMRSAASGQ